MILNLWILNHICNTVHILRENYTAVLGLICNYAEIDNENGH